MAKKGQSGGYFKFFFYLFTFVSLSTLLYFDVEGSWKDSNTRHFLEVSGACKFTHLALDKGKQGLSWVDDRIEENFPGYHKTVIDFSEPYVELAKNLGVIGYNVGVNIKEVAAENYPKVVQSIEAYAPGLMEQSQSAVTNVWLTSVFYYNRSVDYLKTEVFVGQLSPQNMQRVVIEAFNTTQLKATEYYHWLYEKVQTTIK